MNSFWVKAQERICSRYFIGLFLIYFVGIFSIIRANRSYLDDVGRALYGYADWAESARPLTELFAWLFYFGPTTVDASPFTQLLAIGILAAVSLLLLDALRVRLSWATLLCTVPIGLCPYGLENLSYKFDSPWMATALLFAVVPCCFLRRRDPWFLALAALCLFCSASLYQPALGAYICIAVYVCLLELASRKSIRRVFVRLMQFTLPFCIGVGGYALQAPFWFMDSEYTEYIAQHASLPPLAQLPAELAENIPTYVHLLEKDWSGNGLGLLMALLVLFFALHLVARWLHSSRIAGFSLLRAVRLFCIIVLLPVFLLAPFGIQFALSSPVWAPRTFQGFGTFMALMQLSLHAYAKGRVTLWIKRIMQPLLLVQMLVFANVYGNLLDAQNQWELSRISLLASDLNRYIMDTGSSRVSFVGSVGLSPLAVNPARKYPLLERLVTVPLTRDWRWGYEQLNTFGVQVKRQPPPQGLTPEMLTPFIQTSSYRIERGPDDLGVITFLPPPVPRSTKKAPRP